MDLGKRIAPPADAVEPAQNTQRFLVDPIGSRQLPRMGEAVADRLLKPFEVVGASCNPHSVAVVLVIGMVRGLDMKEDQSFDVAGGVSLGSAQLASPAWPWRSIMHCTSRLASF